MPEKTISIPAITCGHCVATIRRELLEIEGVEAVEGDPAAKSVTVRWSEPATWESIRALLEEIGYPPG